MIQRIAITGSSGYCGRTFIRHVRACSPETKILGIDVTAAGDDAPGEFVRLDVRNPDLKRVLDEFRPDTVLHLAFIVHPIHDDRLMHDINVGGSRNVLEAVHAVRPQRFLSASSASVYGAWPDNPVPIAEDWPLRSRTNSRYAEDKCEVESLLVEFAAENSQTAVSWVRPTVIYGPRVRNFLSRFLLNLPIIVLPDGRDVPMQYVHEEDVAAAIWEILSHDARGPFNVGPPDWITLSDIARETKRPTFRLPFWMILPVVTLWWKLRLPLFDYPPALLWFGRYPWVVEPRRLQNEFGFKFQHSSLDTLREMLKAHKRL